jgi:ATP-dependent helicase HrpB
VAAGRQPLLLKLLSPAGRPVQITRDLVSFWNRGYHEVKKDLKGRYPKHFWPDDPRTATPTRRARPRPS